MAIRAPDGANNNDSDNANDNTNAIENNDNNVP